MKTKSEERIKEKGVLVNSLSQEIKDYGAFLVFEYLGLTAEEISEMRREFRKTGAKLVVHKNNILNRSLEAAKLNYDKQITGPNAILLSKNDISSLQNVVKLAKNKEFIKLKLAYFDNVLIADENLSTLASLSSKEDLLVKLAQTIMSPLYKLAFMIKNISV